MLQKIKLELVTPEKIVISQEFESVNAVSVTGEFGVLPGHAPMLALLKPGVVTAINEGQKMVFAIKSGFAEVEPAKIVIMTEEAIKGSDINMEECRSELEKAEAEEKNGMYSIDSTDFKLLQEKLDWLRAKLSAGAISKTK